MTTEKFDAALSLAFLHWASESNAPSVLSSSIAKGLLLKLRAAEELASCVEAREISKTPLDFKQAKAALDYRKAGEMK